jgi:endonuclease/exonuclease/phosphatase family metal-dependent hydrolase
MRVLTYNIKSCQVAGLLAVADAIRAANADVVALQEVARGQAEALARELGMDHAGGVTVKKLGYGNAVLSKAPIEGSEVWLYEPHGEAERRGGILAVVGDLVVVSTHFGLSVAERESQARDLATRVRAWDRVVVGADLNEEPGAATAILAPLVDAFTEAGTPPGATFPSHAPEWRIDYVLVSPGIPVVSCTVVDAHASDHRPVMAALRT